jgi:hypothetical protein
MFSKFFEKSAQKLQTFSSKASDASDLINHSFFGALAQLVERNNGIVEANGSTPLRSILIF